MLHVKDRGTKIESDDDAANSLVSTTIYEPSSKHNSLHAPLTSIEDSIKYHFDITDSITLIRANYYGKSQDEYVRVFVDHNTNSIFHNDILSDYGCDCKDQELYNSIYTESLEEFRDSINVDHVKFKELFGHWIPIYEFENKFYLTRTVCEFNRHGFTLSDSALVEYNMDGLFPSLLLNIKQNGTEFVIKTSNGTYHLKKLNTDNRIYSYEKEHLINSRFEFLSY